jgi:hypothetical protein
MNATVIRDARVADLWREVYVSMVLNYGPSGDAVKMADHAAEQFAARFCDLATRVDIAQNKAEREAGEERYTDIRPMGEV